MKNELRAPDKPYYPKNTLRTLRKTGVLIDELEARREHEEQFKLTPYEKAMHDQLSETFKVSRPAEGIKSATRSSACTEAERQPPYKCPTTKNQWVHPCRYYYFCSKLLLSQTYYLSYYL